MAHHPAPAEDDAPVKRRLVCYLSGFDPQGPAHYHQLYAGEGAKQAAVSGYELEVGKRRKAGEHIAWWEVLWHGPDGGSCQTRYEFLRWDDIVRAHWPRSRAGLYRSTVLASWQMWRNGVMWHTLRTSWPMFVAIAAPGAMLATAALLLMLGLVGCLALALAAPQQLWLVGLVGLLGASVWGLGLLWGEKRTHMAWLMRSMACLVRQGRGQTPSLDERLDALARHVGEQVRSEGYDEVLVVGHSSGAMMAMSVVARALVTEADALAGGATRLSLLTLGHCAPLLSAQPEASWFREELARLVASDRLCWVDYGAPPDGCCFPLVDPSAASGVPGSTPQRPKLANPRFAQLFAAGSYASVRADKFRCHFQYLMAGEIAGGYDFFAITAGPVSLAGRHAAMASTLGFRQFQCWGGPSV